MSTNIFNKAKQANAGKTAKKNEKPSIVITGTEFDENLKKFATLKKEIDEKKQEQFGVFADPACTGNRRL